MNNCFTSLLASLEIVGAFIGHDQKGTDETFSHTLGLLAEGFRISLEFSDFSGDISIRSTSGLIFASSARTGKLLAFE